MTRIEALLKAVLIVALTATAGVVWGTVTPVAQTQQTFGATSTADLGTLAAAKPANRAVVGSASARTFDAVPPGSKTADNVHCFNAYRGAEVVAQWCDTYGMAQTINPSALPANAASAVPSSRALTVSYPLMWDSIIADSTTKDLGADHTMSVANATNTTQGTIALAGDLAGSAATPYVRKLYGATVMTAGGSLTPGTVLYATNASTVDYRFVPYSTLSGIPSAFVPSAHAASHTSTGSDPVPAAVASGASGLLTGTDKAKLDTLSVPPDWHATGGSNWKPPLVDVGTGLQITNSATTAVIGQSYPVPYWHVTGASDVTPSRIDVSRGIEIVDDGVGGVLIETNFDPGAKLDNPVVATVGSSRAYGYVTPPIPFAAPTNHSTTNVGPINAADYGETFNVGTGSTYHLIRIELEIVGFAETSPVGSGKMFSRTFRGMLYRLRSNQHCGIGFDMLPVSALDIPNSSCPGPGCVTSAAMSLSGSNNCNVTFGVVYDSSADSSADWEAAVRIFGGGRY